LRCAGDTRLSGNPNGKSQGVLWFLWGIFMEVLSVPELTCLREHGETLPVINLNKDGQLDQS
jgi:hypothetical protein